MYLPLKELQVKYSEILDRLTAIFVSRTHRKDDVMMLGRIGFPIVMFDRVDRDSPRALRHAYIELRVDKKWSHCQIKCTRRNLGDVERSRLGKLQCTNSMVKIMQP
jgi:hypothetical protein